MKNLFVFLIIFLVFETVLLYGHEQPTHQQITREAFELLKLSYPGLANSEMAQYIGIDEKAHPQGIFSSWGAPKIVAGAWMEDEYDVVYHYGCGEEPSFEQGELNVVLQMIHPVDEREFFTTITHFWNADGGPNQKSLLRDHIGGWYLWSFWVENAMQKMYKYFHGNYNNRCMFEDGFVWACCDPWYLSLGNDWNMHNLFDLYNDYEVMEPVGYFDEVGDWVPADCPTYSPCKWLTYEILGRMCHLLQDMSVPAHVHTNTHPCSNGMYCDYYEQNAPSMTEWTGDAIYNSLGQEYINPYQNYVDPLYFLMYFLNQVTDHYADGENWGDDNYDANCPMLSSIIPTLGLPTSPNQINWTNCSEMHNVIMPLSIRATAGLLYWFAVETGQIPKHNISLNPDQRKLYYDQITTTYTLKNTGDYTETWSASTSEPWVTLLSPSSGTLNPGQQQIISVNLTVNNNTSLRSTNINVQTQSQLFRNTTLVQYGRKYISGTIIDPTTWNPATYFVTNDLTIDEEGTLTIQPHTKVVIYENKKITARGTMKANGTSSESIIFESQPSKRYHSIRIEQQTGTSCQFNYCNISNGMYGIYANQSRPSIQNCTISSCATGIYIYKTLGGYILQNNSIVNGNGTGIYCYQTSGGVELKNLHISGGFNGIFVYNCDPRIISCEIENTERGVASVWFAAPMFSPPGGGPPYLPGCNYIHDNEWAGVWNEISNSLVGDVLDCTDGINSFVNNSSQIIAVDYGWVGAEDCWWGRTNPKSYWFVQEGGTIDYTPWLDHDPFNDECDQRSQEEIIVDEDFRKIAKESYSSFEPMKYYKSNWPMDKKIKFASILFYIENNNGLQKVCKDIIAENPKSENALTALIFLWNSIKEETSHIVKSELKSYLHQISIEYNSNPVAGAAELMLADYTDELDLGKVDNVFNSYRNTPLAKAALSRKFQYYFADKNDLDKARQVVKQIEQYYPNSTLLFDSKVLLGDEVDINSFKNINSKTLTNVEPTKLESLLPQKYDLAGNYPNPFNPITHIKYALPRLSSIEFTIFNSMGQKVASYALSSKQAGYHEFIWTGKNDLGENVASGVYFVKFKSSSIEGKKESYEKSIKVTLVR